MQNNKLQFSGGAIFGVIFFILIFSSILMKDFIFDLIINDLGSNSIEESKASSKQTEDLLLSLEKISFDTSVLNSDYIQSVNLLPEFSIDATTLSNFGKSNPFLGSFIVVPTKATTSVGAVIYSNQRAANNGNSLRAVAPGRR